MIQTGTEQSHHRRTLLKRRFLPLLVPLVLWLAMQPLAAEGTLPMWVSEAVLVLLLLATLRILRKSRTLFLAGTALLVFAILGSLGVTFMDEGTTRVVAERFNFSSVIALLVMTAIYISKETIRERMITVDTLLGVVCVYLLVSVSFSFGYVLLETVRAGSFSGIPGASSEHSYQLFADLSYYSLVTLTTLGYGDISPIHPLARSLATLEAVFGQFFVAAVVGLLVGRKTSDPGPGAGELAT